jgi:hypothetical protein
MSKMTVGIDVNAEPRSGWALLSDFANVDWLPGAGLFRSTATGPERVAPCMVSVSTAASKDAAYRRAVLRQGSGRKVASVESLETDSHGNNVRGAHHLPTVTDTSSDLR